MRAKDFIVENDGSITPIPNEQLQDFIYENCREWVEKTDSHDGIIYRGVNRPPIIDNYSEMNAFVKPTRLDRKPRDSLPALHQIFNNVLQAANSPVNRSNSLFCTSSASEAREYGKVYVLFPIGNFDYMWSPYYEDWTRKFKVTAIVSTLLKPGVFSNEDAQRMWWNVEIKDNPLMQQVYKNLQDSSIINKINSINEVNNRASIKSFL